MLTDELADLLEFDAPRKGSLPSLMQVMLCLRFYATGTFQSVIGEMFGVDMSTVSRTVNRVTKALVRQLPNWTCLPKQEDADVTKEKFYMKAGFPNVIGCVDGTHVRILAPTINEHEYVNRKNFHSINVQLICDADMRIINCVAKWPGSVHDARILRESAIFNSFESNQKPLSGYILGDSGYMLREWLLTPVVTIRTPKDVAYNTAHSVTRCTIERCIGILKRRWHCLHTELRVAPDRACQIICACVVLHNRSIDFRNPMDHFTSDDRNNGDDDNCVAAIGMQTTTEQARLALGKATRDMLINNLF